MATTVNAGFDTLTTWLIPSSADVNAARSHRSSIEAKLSEALGVTNFFGTGSSENSTDVAQYSDVDYFASIPTDHQRNDSAYMLTVLKNTLQERFWATDIHVSTPAVVLNFGSNGSEKVEITPAYYAGRDPVDDFNVYKIPTTGGGWITSSPSVHNKYVTGQNVRLNSKLKPLIRLIKAIAYYNNIQISSFYLELRITKWATSETTIVYSIDVKNMLKHLIDCELAQMQDPMGVSGYIAPTFTDSQRIDALSKFRSAYNRAVYARQYEEANNMALAFEYWDKVFAGRFPAYG